MTGSTSEMVLQASRRYPYDTREQADPGLRESEGILHVDAGSTDRGGGGEKARLLGPSLPSSDPETIRIGDAPGSQETGPKSKLSRRTVVLLATMYLAYCTAIFSSSSLEVAIPGETICCL
jgi:hypothetical protein